jgi:GT2 family glycosyltransferase
MDSVSVIIVVFNVPSYTEACLRSLYETDHGYPIAPIIVDNGSRKKTAELISAWASEYDSLSEDKKKNILRPKIITNPFNNGFSGGMNAALKIVETKLVCILHNDCIVFPNWIKEMASLFDDADEDIAVIIPRTNYSNEASPCILEIREKFEKIKPSNKARTSVEEINAMINVLYPNKTEFLDNLMSAQLKATYCPEISSFCMLVKSELFEQYGKFDESFWPRGFEDKFWFRSLERNGLICMIANRSYVHHFGNITSDGNGFCFVDSMRINEQKFKDKWVETDKNKTYKTDVV